MCYKCQEAKTDHTSNEMSLPVNLLVMLCFGNLGIEQDHRERNHSFCLPPSHTAVSFANSGLRDVYLGIVYTGEAEHRSFMPPAAGRIAKPCNLPICSD